MHPLSLGRPLRLLADHRQPALERLDAVPAQLEVVETTLPNDVRVRIVEARESRAWPLGVDHAGLLAAMPRHLRVVADSDELAVLHREGGRLRTLRVHRDDLGVRDDEVGRLLLSRCSRTPIAAITRAIDRTTDCRWIHGMYLRMPAAQSGRHIQPVRQLSMHPTPLSRSLTSSALARLPGPSGSSRTTAR